MVNHEGARPLVALPIEPRITPWVECRRRGVIIWTTPTAPPPQNTFVIVGFNGGIIRLLCILATNHWDSWHKSKQWYYAKHRHLKERTCITKLWGFELGTQVVIYDFSALNWSNVTNYAPKYLWRCQDL